MTELFDGPDQPHHSVATASKLRRIGRFAVVALYDELALDPKPGLVSFVDAGSHDDMNATTFIRSLFALRHYFPRIAALGSESAPFHQLEREGIAAEERMLQSTKGVNTHRGAIFTLGVLCATAGALVADGRLVQADLLRTRLVTTWGDALLQHSRKPSQSNGRHAARQFNLRSVGEEAAAGFPTLFETAVPALLRARRQGLRERCVRVQALFHIMAVLDDTNLAHRGGLEGLRFVRRAAQDFLHAGGVGRTDGMAHAQSIHREFVARNLSPGGAADTLAAALWIDRVCRTEEIRV